MTHLRLLRMKRGLTQKHMAKLLGIHPTVMNRVEQGWFAKCPAGLEQTLKAFFGPEWGFAELMHEVHDTGMERPESSVRRAEE